MWGGWIEEDLIEGPKAKSQRRGENPLWEYSTGATARASAQLQSAPPPALAQKPTMH
jgi:hypothetical protein